MYHLHPKILACLFLCIIGTVNSFTSPSFGAKFLPKRQTARFAESNDDDRNDFRSFLTQRSIQSFMFLLAETRDLHTVRWVDKFIKPSVSIGGEPDEDEEGEEDKEKDDEDEDEDDEDEEDEDNDKDEAKSDMPFATSPESDIKREKVASKLLFYHGLDALNSTLFPHWDSFFLTLLDLPISILEVETRYTQSVPSYEIEMNPARICARILSVREQISKEFGRDLDVIESMGRGMLRSYWEKLDKHRTEESMEGERKAFDRYGLLFLDNPNEEFGTAPSPLRKGNFDLLVLLATRAALRRIFTHDIPLADSEKEARISREFLYDFYTERLPSYFYGNQRYGRADDFMEDLMLSPPRMLTSKGKDALFVDPLRIAEVIVQQREEVVREWKEVAGVVPEEHFEIRKLQLKRMMEM